LKDFISLKGISFQALSYALLGFLLYSERMVVFAFLSGRGETSLGIYFVVYPLCSILWRWPHLMGRILRKEGDLLKEQMKLYTTYWVLVFNLGLVFFFALGLRFLFPEHVIDYGRVLLLMMVLASVSPLLSYFWYSSWALEFMFGCAFLLYLFKWLNPGLFFVFLFFFGVKAVKRMTVGAFYRVTYIKINQGHPSTLRQTLMASYPLMQIRILGGKVMELRYPKAVHKDVTEKVFVETLGKVDVLDQNPFGDQALLLHSSQFKKTKINILGSLTSLKLFQNPDDLKLLRRKLQKYKSTQRAQVLMLRHQRYSLGRSGRKGFLGLMRL
jgi:hypothetical protein